MIIDFHTHVFPDSVAEKAIPHMAEISHTSPSLDGTLNALKMSMSQSEVNCSVVLPVVTSPRQFSSINQFALEHTAKDRTHLNNETIFFAGIHPDTADYRHALNELRKMGFLGIKLHPYYQDTNFDDIRYMRIIDYASELGFLITVHAGFDPGFPHILNCSPQQILKVMNTVKPKQLILAHLGGFLCWDEVFDSIAGLNLYMDTSNIISYIQPGQFLKIVRKHGADKILFATDSPWQPQQQNIEAIRKMGLNKEEEEAILGKNAARLLNISI